MVVVRDQSSSSHSEFSEESNQFETKNLTRPSHGCAPAYAQTCSTVDDGCILSPRNASSNNANGSNHHRTPLEDAGKLTLPWTVVLVTDCARVTMVMNCIVTPVLHGCVTMKHAHADRISWRSHTSLRSVPS